MDLSSEVWCAAFDSMTPEGPKYTTVPTPAGRFTDLCTGSYSCGIRESPGQVECWNPKDDVYLAPTALPQRRLESLDCLGSVMCAVIRQGALSCWGVDTVGETQPPP